MHLKVESAPYKPIIIIMKKFTLILIISLFLITAYFVEAHQPRLVKEEVIAIENPEVSQAFYAELTSKSQVYTINSEVPFKLYLGLLVPDIPGIEKDVSALIKKEDHEHEHDREKQTHKHDKFKVLLDGSTHEWTSYYEKHAGDDYFIGPALQADDSDSALHPKGVDAEAGEYTVKVFSPDNEGKYVLVVGDKEEFPLFEIINTVIQVPQIKIYFGKSPLSAFSTPTMLGFLAMTLILLTAVIGLVIFAVKGFYKN